MRNDILAPIQPFNHSTIQLINHYGFETSNFSKTPFSAFAR
ncbi:hypothetical protein Cabys_1811 [Caldithrix abyssi DSM 13497]|uniref:Uncharacterized protein n=1 Tax=Caldithrix abyssi DSM 13497 TaxID=880073 RepID=A0A1J1C9H2_CALAY|nr:hypothetical protein Cabys_1811 [Caldithrix abyssi DSM 13497]